MLTWPAQVMEPPPLGLTPSPGCGPAAPSVALGEGPASSLVRLPVLWALFAMHPPSGLCWLRSPRHLGAL